MSRWDLVLYLALCGVALLDMIQDRWDHAACLLVVAVLVRVNALDRRQR